jgi:hypothetical protein
VNRTALPRTTPGPNGPVRLRLIYGDADQSRTDTTRIPAPWLRPPVTATYRRPTRWQRFNRSRFARDLRDWGWLIGLLAAAVLCMAGGDHLHALATGGHL